MVRWQRLPFHSEVIIAHRQPLKELLSRSQFPKQAILLCLESFLKRITAPVLFPPLKVSVILCVLRLYQVEEVLVRRQRKGFARLFIVADVTDIDC